MRAHVYPDRALAKHAGRFVWLSIDTEKDANSDFLEKVPVKAWPTLMVVDPRSGEVALRWPGSASVPQLEALLDDGARVVAAMQRGTAPEPAGADALADRATLRYAAHQVAEAIQLWRAALEKGGAAWPGRPHAVEALVGALMETGDLEGCARLALAEAPTMPRGPSFANAVGGGLSCAEDGGQDWAPGLSAALEPLAREALGLASVLADDRSSLYEALVQSRKAAGDAAGTKTIAGEWLDFLEAQAAKAPTAEARAAFDPHRVAASLALGDPARAVPALEKSERDLPEDYNPPARLALLFKALGRLDDALAASDRALVRVYGPRRLRLLESRAEILVAKGDLAGAHKALDDAITLGDGLPKSQRSAPQIERLKAARAKLEGK